MELNVSTPTVQTAMPESKGQNQAEMMKSIRKARLERQVMADPSLAAKLVSVEATATYNASGDLVQTLGGNLGEV